MISLHALYDISLGFEHSPLLTKPFGSDELLSTVRQELARVRALIASAEGSHRTS